MLTLSNDQKAIAIIGSTLIQILKALDHPIEAGKLDEKLKMWLNEIIETEKATAKKRDSSSFKIILPEGNTVKETLSPQTQA